MKKLFSITAVALLVTASCFHSQASASVLLGSFENPPNGQDDPIEAVISAINAATGVNYLGLQLLYKNDFNEDTGGGADTNNLFSTTYNTLVDNGKYEATGGTISKVGNEPIVLAGVTFTPLFYTAKIDGQNAGFNLYSWGTANTFDWGFYKDLTNGLDYSYLDLGPFSWAEPTDPLVGEKVTYGVSHVSVFGAFVDDNGGGGGSGGGGGTGVVPEPASLAIFCGLLGMAGFIRRRNGVAKK